MTGQDMETGGRFGFGCMRMPVTNREKADSFDYEKIGNLFDLFIERGFRYFDTAFTYHGYHAEEAVRRALVERYPRDRFELATKMPLRDFKDADDLEKIFQNQLDTCGVSYFDCYLLHNLGHNVYAKCEKHDAFGFVGRKKAEGKARFVGMSFHDAPELLEEVLSRHGDGIDFVQLQINYVDWEQPNVESRRCLAVANKFKKPVIVMEPCKGGTLTNVPEEAERLMKEYAPNASVASWAMRFAASQPGVIRVLSGMNEPGQVEDNAATFTDFRPLADDEYKVLENVRKILLANTAIPCTACEYCTHDCPKNIPIPKYFALYNNVKRSTGSFSSQPVYYNNIALSGHGRAGDCAKCGRCESACPQRLPIRKYLEDVKGVFETGAGFPVRPSDR